VISRSGRSSELQQPDGSRSRYGENR
jgi:hypothetical protein